MDNILTYMTFIPLAGMFAVMAIPRDRHNLIRQVSLAATIPPLLMAIWLFANFDRTTADFQFMQRMPWLPSFNIQFIMGIDGLSVTMVLLTALLCPICLLSSWNIEKGVKGYHMLFLLLNTAMMGVFCALDFFLFFIFWEVMLLPMYFLIGVWGGPRREYAAIKFFLYTQLGGVLMLISMLALYFYNGPHTFNMTSLMANASTYARGFQLIVWIALFIGFAIKIPAFPFHTWLPDAHVEAPTAISVILAGVLLKMGTYGILRINYPMLPLATQECAFWALAALGTWGVVYGALCAMAQTDMKKLVAYSSISHMGYVMLGMATLTPQGINGAVLQMFNHGTITAMLFLLVGVVYDRAHHRNIDGFGGLASVMPTYTGIMSIAFFAALGLPGLSAFISEALVFLGAWQYSPPLTIIAASSVVLTAGYMLWLLQRVWLGPVNEKYADMPDVTSREIVTLVPLAIIVLILGVQPHFVLDLINPTLLAINHTVSAANAVAQATVLP
ncbi:MAG: NADH-quinone oxidoreductase subunit M [Myxococcales bacterium]|nr:MAG: NADH-quinone oxidoreductase subunit M [Myxococcales bacterium]